MHGLRRVALCALALMILVPIAFGQTKPIAGKKVAIMWGGTDAPFVGPHIAAFKDTIEKAGGQVIVFDSKWDPAKQATDLEDAITMKVDLVCLVPVDPVAIIPALKKAKSSKVPVMVINTETTDEGLPYIVGFSGAGAYEQGQVAAQILLEAIGGKGKIAVVEGVSGFNLCVLYMKALEEAIAKGSNKVSIVAVQPANWAPAEATKATEDFVTRFQNLDAIYAYDDYMAGGVIVALKEAGLKPGKIKVIGVGGTGDALRAIKEGWMYGTVLQSPITEGIFEAERAIEFLKTGKVSPFRKIIDNPRIDPSNVGKFKAEF